jgi:subtilisin family serine protease
LAGEPLIRPPFRGTRTKSFAVSLTIVSRESGLRLKYAVLILATALLGLAPAAAGAGGTSPTRGFQAHLELAASPAQYVPGELLVGFRAGAERGAVRRVNARVGARVSERFPARMQLVKLPRGLAVRDAAREYRRDPAVAFAEPNYLRYPTSLPTDELFSDLWALNNTGQSHAVSDANGDHTATPRSGAADADIDAPEAWDVQAGNGTVVAVIDTGVDVAHPDLAGQLWTNPGETPSNGVDDDLNGKIDDVNGWDFGNNDSTLLSSNPFLGYEHGTHVAGTIAAVRDDNGTNDGVVGVCPACRIMVLKIARDSDGALPISAEIAAFAYAKSKGAKIVNLSLGGPAWSMAEREAMRKSGLLAVIAAGNDSLDNDMALASDFDGDGQADILSPFYPAAYALPNIFAVGASNHNDEHGYQTECHTTFGFSKPLCAFTNWGHDSVDVSAPGVDITSTVPGASWETWDGTSMAAPHVAGIAALVLAQNSTFTVAQLKNAVMHSVDKPALLKTMYFNTAPGLTGPAGTTKSGSFTRTSGRVNALNALSASTTNATPLTDGNVNGAKGMSRTKISGSVAWPADVNDVVKRRLRRGRIYRFMLVVPSGKDYDLYVWKPGAKEIWQPPKIRGWSARAGAVDEVVTFKAGTTGVYYMQVSAWLFKSGRYTLKFARLA